MGLSQVPPSRRALYSSAATTTGRQPARTRPLRGCAGREELERNSERMTLSGIGPLIKGSQTDRPWYRSPIRHVPDQPSGTRCRHGCGAGARLHRGVGLQHLAGERRRHPVVLSDQARAPDAQPLPRPAAERRPVRRRGGGRPPPRHQGDGADGFLQGQRRRWPTGTPTGSSSTRRATASRSQGQVSVDPSSGYYQEKLFEVLDEMIDLYPLDGFFFNMFRFAEYDYAKRYRGVSQSESSPRRASPPFSGGRQHPTGPDSPTYDLWRAYAAEVTRKIGVRIAEHVKARRPDACLLRSDDLDLLRGEQRGRPRAVAPPRQRDDQRLPHAAAAPAGAVPLRAFVDMPYRIASEQPEHFAQHLIQGIARGANISTYIMGVPGEIEYPSLDVAREIMHFHRDHDEVYRRPRPGRACRPRPSRRAGHEPRSLPRGEGRVPRALRGAPGGASAVRRRARRGHWPTWTANGGLDRYSVLLLADVGPLTARGGRGRSTPSSPAAGGWSLTGRSAFDAEGRAQLAALPATPHHRTDHRSRTR